MNPALLTDRQIAGAGTLVVRRDRVCVRSRLSPRFLFAIPVYLLLCVASYELAAQRTRPSGEQVEVITPGRLGASHFDVTRVAVGIPQDYKPCLARLPSGELLLVGFQTTGGVPKEYCFLYRSADGGRTWSKRRRLDLVGREPYLSVTRDGTVFISTHMLNGARGNTEGYVFSNLYRSTDAGRTFTRTKIGHELVRGARPGQVAQRTRLPDGV